jgi:hypothetical protein
MKIENLKDLKDALAAIPDEVLKNFVIGWSEDEFGVGTTEGEDEVKMMENYERDVKKYPELKTIERYVKNIAKEVQNEETDGYPVSSKDVKK